MKIDGAFARSGYQGSDTVSGAALPFGPRHRHGAFAQLLQHGQNGIDRKPGVIALTNGSGGEVVTNFVTRAEIGDGAVRFDARAIVGRTAIEEEEVGHRSSPLFQDDEIAAAPPDAALRNLLRETEGQWSTVVDRASDTRRNGEPFKPVDAAAVRNGTAEHQTRAASAASPVPRNMQSKVDTGAASSTRRPATRMPSDKTMFAARLDTLPGEVTVSIRGMMLSDDDSRTLVEALRDLLHQYRLSGRSVRVVAMTGRAQ